MPRLVAIHEGNVSFVHAPRAFGFVAQGVVNWFDSLVPKRRLVKREACLMSSCIWEIISETERFEWLVLVSVEDSVRLSVKISP